MRDYFQCCVFGMEKVQTVDGTVVTNSKASVRLFEWFETSTL